MRASEERAAPRRPQTRKKEATKRKHQSLSPYLGPLLPGVAAAAAVVLLARLEPVGAVTRARSSCCEATVEALLLLLLRDSAESDDESDDDAATGTRQGDRAAATAAVATAPPLRVAVDPVLADPVPRRGGVGRIVGEAGRREMKEKASACFFFPSRLFEGEKSERGVKKNQRRYFFHFSFFSFPDAFQSKAPEVLRGRGREGHGRLPFVG